MRMTQQILIDLDDTLIHCNRHFTWIREKFVSRMSELFRDYPVDPDLIARTQQQIDVAGVRRAGLGKNRFPESLVQTYLLMCGKYGKTPDPQEQREIFELGCSVYDFEPELYPGAMETLETLRDSGYGMYLYTGGDFEIQTRKILKAGLADFFPEERRFIFEYKNALTLKKILRMGKFPRRMTWMVGNSARSDILPALELGLNAIHIPDSFGWAYDQVELNVTAKGHFFVLKSIVEVPDVIERSVKGNLGVREHLG